ncbi:MAG TPA: hypothetical protein PKD84_04470 [Propionicimonas sp.]|nr:hypothetical protein [Propionicimonas sp.]
MSNSSNPVAQTASELRDILAMHGLDRDALIPLLNREHLTPVIDWVLLDEGSTPSRKAMRELVHAVQSKLDLPDDAVTANLAEPIVRLGSFVRSIFAGTVLVLAGWTVLGEILTGHNDMAAHTSIPVTLTVLIVALTVLALLEAAHIGAVALSTADVSELHATHARVVRLHAHIDTKSKLEHYLAARQVGVVLTVFLISEVTRTAGMHTLPGTTIAIPATFDILFQIGAPGALLVLVLGQVLPQIITARMPARMMNLLPMAAAFYVTLAIGQLHLAEPATWLVAWIKGGERIPSAARERYESNTVDATGYGALMNTTAVSIKGNSTKVVTTQTVLFHTDDLSALKVDLASYPYPPSTLRIDAAILRDKEIRPVATSGIEEARGFGTDDLLVHTTAAPLIGNFQAGDVLRIITTAGYDQTRLSRITSSVGVATKVTSIRVTVEDPRFPVPPGHAELSRSGDQNVEWSTPVSPQTSPTGAVSFETSRQYVDADAAFTVRWNDLESSKVPPTSFDISGNR